MYGKRSSSSRSRICFRLVNSTMRILILRCKGTEQMNTEQENGGVKRKVGITERHLCLAGIFPSLIAPTPRRTRNTAAVAAQAHLLTTAIVLSLSLLPGASEILLCGRTEKQGSERKRMVETGAWLQRSWSRVFCSKAGPLIEWPLSPQHQTAGYDGASAMVLLFLSTYKREI